MAAGTRRQARFGAIRAEVYSSAQPTSSKYDYLLSGKKISVLVIITRDKLDRVDRVYGVYRVADDFVEGPSEQILTTAEQTIHEKDSYPCRRFQLNRIASTCVGMAVTGWKGKEQTTVQRSTGGFFNEIEVGNNRDYVLLDEVTKSFQFQLDASNSDTSEARLARLAKAERLPKRLLVTSYYYVRNVDVVAESLALANGICQKCMTPAPFVRRSDSSPYLEVHHSVPLAQGGQDTLENAIALCPNCHRKAHFE